MLITLIGLPAVGKSTIGRRLAQRLGVGFIDCDRLLEERLGESIASFFEREGEAEFRGRETALLAEILEGRSGVVATGGGVVESEHNRELLRRHSHCVYLRAEPRTLLPRIARNSRRPMFKGNDPAERLRELTLRREPLYRDVAHVEVEIDGEAAGRTVDRVVAALDTAVAAVGGSAR